MDDYIKREAAIEICEAEYQARLRMCDYCGDTVAWNIGSEIKALPAADVAPVVHGRCPVCSGKEVLAQDCDNGYCVEIDAEQAEMTIWQGDTCLAVISIDFCPNCGASMDGDSDA